LLYAAAIRENMLEQDSSILSTTTAYHETVAKVPVSGVGMLVFDTNPVKRWE
jgi:hypothetical protein